MVLGLRLRSWPPSPLPRTERLPVLSGRLLCSRRVDLACSSRRFGIERFAVEGGALGVPVDVFSSPKLSC